MFGKFPKKNLSATSSVKDEDLIVAGGDQRLLFLYHFFHIVIGVALLLAMLYDRSLEHSGLAYPQIYAYSIVIYFAFNLVTLLFARHAPTGWRLFLITQTDIVMLCCVFFAGGGVQSGLGSLVVASVAVANLLVYGQWGFVLAAMASLLMIVMSFLVERLTDSDLFNIGILGALCFGASYLMQVVRSRILSSESLVALKISEVQDMSALNSAIIQRMRTGLLLLDDQKKILMSNLAAQELLGVTALRSGVSLKLLSSQLADFFDRWYANPSLKTESWQPQHIGPQVQPSFVSMKHMGKITFLVFLEDNLRLEQKAKQLNLASLGRLTASIAHEIRNPLGAIGHAAQLLLEDQDLNDGNRRLIEIVDAQSHRVNEIIENVLQLSRRKPSSASTLDLNQWLINFKKEFDANKSSAEKLHLSFTQESVEVPFDGSQLQQVMNNLVNNGLRYSHKSDPTQAEVWISLSVSENGQAMLTVIDNGNGVAKENLSQLFEPFFTTESKGTGLGLYLSRELCISNRARLDYVVSEKSQGCFRITFAHIHA